MTTSKIPPPRKLTESEDIDSFDDWWFQAVCYYGRGENFKELSNMPKTIWPKTEEVSFLFASIV